MYTNMKNVQILISLLKKYNIRNLVLAPGGSDIPIIHSVEEDNFFNCYSVVDERSLVYFAIGLAQEKKEPVACVCTSGTAVSNFLPGITEAFYQNVPIVAITGDKNPYYLEQLETQKINQMGIFDNVCKKCVNLPIVNNEMDEWLCGRLINEALIELNHHGKGPVQINIPIMGDPTVYTENSLPDVKKISVIDYSMSNEVWDSYSLKLEKYSKILVIVGQNVDFDDKLKMKMEYAHKKYGMVFSVENLSNAEFDGTIHTYPLTEMEKNNIPSELVPDLVISMGNNISSYCIKSFIRDHKKQIEHWEIDESGRIRDTYLCLTTVFECSPSFFFDRLVDESVNGGNSLYFEAWKNNIAKLSIPDFEYSNFYTAKVLSEVIPENSILHLAILNSTRVMQFFKLKDNVKVYSNIGALGIDGCLSTFAGQAAATDELAFCLIGDLSFFYDMNAASIRHISNNARIILMNNGGAAEFHFFMGKDKIPTINQFISVENNRTAKGWVESLGFKYYSVKDKNDVGQIFPKLAEHSDQPVFVEIFGEMETDASLSKEFYNSNYPQNFKSSIKKLSGKVLSEKNYQKLLKVYGKFRG